MRDKWRTILWIIIGIVVTVGGWFTPARSVSLVGLGIVAVALAVRAAAIATDETKPLPAPLPEQTSPIAWPLERECKGNLFDLETARNIAQKSFSLVLERCNVLSTYTLEYVDHKQEYDSSDNIWFVCSEFRLSFSHGQDGLRVSILSLYDPKWLELSILLDILDDGEIKDHWHLNNRIEYARLAKAFLREFDAVKEALGPQKCSATVELYERLEREDRLKQHPNSGFMDKDV